MSELKRVLVGEQKINEIYAERAIKLPVEHDINSHAILTNNHNPKNTAIARYTGDNTWCLIRKNQQLIISGMTPKDAKQCAFVDCLLNDDVPVNVATGPAGTGKTTLALAYAGQVYLNEGKSIVLCKPTPLVTHKTHQAFGPVPGDIEEKYAPYLESFKIVLKKVFNSNDDTYFQKMMKNKHLQYQPLEFIRGNTYEDCTFILDEAQNISWHEMKSVVSRLGSNAKIIIIGDLDQIDIDIPKEDTGLYQMIKSASFKKSNLTSTIELDTQYRSEVATLIHNIDKEIKKN